jgi:hypothetical protein
MTCLRMSVAHLRRICRTGIFSDHLLLAMTGLLVASGQEHVYSVNLNRQPNGQWTQGGQVRARAVSIRRQPCSRPCNATHP